MFTHLFKRNVVNGIFSGILKHSVVIPLHKKGKNILLKTIGLLIYCHLMNLALTHIEFLVKTEFNFA